MKNIICQLSKTNLIGACLLACVFSVLSNNAFTFAAGFVVNESTAGIANNLIDVAQLAVYVSVKVARFGRLNRYDLPFVIGGVLSIAL